VRCRPSSNHDSFFFTNWNTGVTMNWSDPQPIDEREVDLTEPRDWRLLRMTPDDIRMLESELRLLVPVFLCEWLVENPFRNFPHQQRSLVCHRDRLIHQNVELRREGYYGRKWPENLLWIGDDWSGGAYFVNLADSSPAVYWYDWEEGTGDTVKPENSERYSPAEFIRHIGELG
jgi:hypothetical protein